MINNKETNVGYISWLRENLQANAVVQLSMDFELVPFRGCFMTVMKKTNYGAVGYTLAPDVNGPKAFQLKAKFSEIQFIGYAKEILHVQPQEEESE